MKIGIIGCGGRMGRTLVEQVLNTKGAKLAGGTEQKGNALIGKDIAEMIGAPKAGIKITDNAESLIKAADAIIDFTAPASTLKNAELAAKYKKTHVIGTTGLSDAQKKQIQKFGEKTVIVLAPNMSIGVNLLMSLTQRVAEILDISYDIEIVEMHHKHKVDAPSGTALGLGEAAAKGRKVNLDKVADKVRDGHTGARKAGDIGFATLRGGDVVGDHTVIFATEGERIELTHKASNRVIFAKGAVKAAMWSKGKKAGFYSMQDVIGL